MSATFDEEMRKKWVIAVLVVVVTMTYALGYRKARRDHILIRRIDPVFSTDGLVLENHIIRGKFGPGKGAILVSPAEIDLFYYAFTPLRVLEAKYRNITSNQRLEATVVPPAPQP